MTKLSWTKDMTRAGGTCEREFCFERAGKAVPGIVWHPEKPSGARPLILLGHGGSGHKRSAKLLQLGQVLATDYGYFAAAIDGPAHGGRGPVKDATDPSYRQMWQRPSVVQDMIDDWTAALDALCTLTGIDVNRIGYWGVSMGTMFGLPFVATDKRIRVAVLGKAGMTGPSVTRSGIDAHFKVYAPKLAIPVLFAMKWDDERFDRNGQLALFDMLGSTDKRLLAHPGEHSEDGPDVLEIGARFLRRHLV